MLDIKNADNDNQELFNYISQISQDIINKYTRSLDDIIQRLNKEIDTCSNDELRTYMIKICIETYHLGVDREYSSLKEQCAEALYKEKIAQVFNTSTGTVEARKNQSIIDTVDKQAVSMLYANVASLFKTKVDEAHRLVSAINGILISRAADAKIQYNPRSVGDQVYINDDQVNL